MRLIFVPFGRNCANEYGGLPPMLKRWMMEMRRCFSALVRQGHSRWMMAIMVAVLLLTGPPLSHAGSQVENAREKMDTLIEQAKVAEQKAEAVVERKGVTLMEKVAAYDQVIALSERIIAIYDSMTLLREQAKNAPPEAAPPTAATAAVKRAQDNAAQRVKAATAQEQEAIKRLAAANRKPAEPEQANAIQKATVPPFDSGAVRAMLTRQGFDKSFVDAMVALGEENRRQIATGEISPEYTVRIDEVQPFTEKQRLNQLLDQGALLPKYPRLLPVLTRDNFAEVVQDLYKLDDISVWLRQPNGAPLNEAELARYRGEQADDEQRLLRSPAEFEKKYGSQAVDEWLSLFNRLQPRIAFPARELYRRLLRDCRVLIIYRQVSEKGRAAFASFTGSALGEILLLTKPEPGLTLTRCTLYYPEPSLAKPFLFPTNEQIEANGIAIDGFTGLQVKMLEGFARDAAKHQEIGKMDANIAQSRANIAQSIAHRATLKKIAALSNEIEWLVKAYAAERSTTLVPLIEKRIGSIEAMSRRLDALPEEEQKEWGWRGSELPGSYMQYMVGKLYIGKFRELRGGK
ncbi:MAG: hypothetical protein ACYC6S_03610 [Desulfobulbia bacterium]